MEKKMKIALSVDSACDIPKQIIKDNNIFVMPYYVILGENEYKDGEISQNELYEYAKKTGVLPKTAAINVEVFKEYFTNILKEYDAIIHISLSNNMSSSCRNAQESAKELENVYIVDSKNLSSGIGLLAMSCLDKMKENKDVKQIVEELNSETEKVQASFLVDTLKFLYKGGRCSALASMVASLLKMKPMIMVKNGSLTVGKKYYGNINNGLRKYLDNLLSTTTPNKKRVFVTHSSPMEISSELCQKLKEYGFEEVYDCDASSTISTHCGPNTLGVLFMVD